MPACRHWWPSAASPASGRSPPPAVELLRFAEAVSGDTVEAMQERFTRAFDFDPKCSLDIGCTRSV